MSTSEEKGSEHSPLRSARKRNEQPNEEREGKRKENEGGGERREEESKLCLVPHVFMSNTSTTIFMVPEGQQARPFSHAVGLL
jgi:hypothetical protein